MNAIIPNGQPDNSARNSDATVYSAVSPTDDFCFCKVMECILFSGSLGMDGIDGHTFTLQMSRGDS